MIVVFIYYKGKNKNALKFAKEMKQKGIVDKIKAKEGNIRYDYFIPFDDEETVVLIDGWENEKTLFEHHNSSIMQDIIELRNKYDLKMTVERYELKQEDIPEFDKSFIR